MTLRRLGIIGSGGIAELALTALANGLEAPLEHVAVLVPEAVVPQARELMGRVGSKLTRSHAIHTNGAALLADHPEVVAECASHVALRDHGPSVLAAGCDLIVISIGALSDDGLRSKLEAAARKGHSRVILPAGAIGGVDALAAARLSGIEAVTYTGRKPPKAWRGTPAESLLDLESLSSPTTFFEGSARQAAQDYPFNANVAATLALAGIGFEHTRVQLVADPTVSRNLHEFAVQAGCGDFSIRLEGRPSSSNPKTSQMAGYSVGRELLNRAGVLVI